MKRPTCKCWGILHILLTTSIPRWHKILDAQAQLIQKTSPAMQCNQTLCGIPNCGQFSNCGSFSQLLNCSQVPHYGQVSDRGQYGPCNPVSQCNGSPYPQIVGEGEVTSLVLPDGSIQLYFQPTIKLCPPFIQNPYLRCYNSPFINSNTAWLVRNVHSSNSVNPFGNAEPQPIFHQHSQFPYLPIQMVPPCQCQLKFHNDSWSSTTDLKYFYPRVRSEVISKPCAGVQVSVPAVPPCHCDMVYTKLCNCYQENAALCSSHGDTKSKHICECHDTKSKHICKCHDTKSQHICECHDTKSQHICECHSKREKDVTSSQSHMSIDEAIPEKTSSRKFKPTKKSKKKSRDDIFCKCCPPSRSKGIVIASSQSGMSNEETKSKAGICKRAKKDKTKEKSKKKDQSRENLCSCYSSTAATSSSRTSTENKKKLKREKMKKDKSYQSESRGNKTKEKSKKKDQSQEDLCSCCSSTAATSSSRTSTENKEKSKREKKKKEKKNYLSESKNNGDCECISQSESNNNSCIYDADERSKICNEHLTAGSAKAERKRKRKSSKDKNIKKNKQYHSRDRSQESLDSCCLTVKSNSSRTSTEKIPKRRRQKESRLVIDFTSQAESMTIADNILKLGEDISAGSTPSKRRKLMIKDKKKNHVCEGPSSLESKENICCIHLKPEVNTQTFCSFGNTENEIINDYECDCDMQAENSNNQVNTEQASCCTVGTCDSQIICDIHPIIENPMLNCVFSAVCSDSEVPSINLATSFNDTNNTITEPELWCPITPETKKAFESDYF